MNSNNSSQVTKLPTVAELALEIAEIFNKSMIAIGQRLVFCFEAKPELRTQLINPPHNIDAKLLTRLEQLGRGQVDPMAQSYLLDKGVPTQRLLKAPPTVQREILTNGVNVLDPNETDSRQIPFKDLTPDQAKLALDRTGNPRSLAQQRTLLRELKAKRNGQSTEEPDPSYRVFSDHVVIHKRMKVSRHLLVQWLSQMK